MLSEKDDRLTGSGRPKKNPKKSNQQKALLEKRHQRVITKNETLVLNNKRLEKRYFKKDLAYRDSLKETAFLKMKSLMVSVQSDQIKNLKE